VQKLVKCINQSWWCT